MPLSLVDFWKRLLQSGLADSSTPRLWAADFASDHDATPPPDPLTLAKWLVQTGRLKPFQAVCLTRPNPNAETQGSEKKTFRFPMLRIAPLTQASEQPRPPFTRWLPVTHDSYPGQAGVVLQISPAGLTPADGDRLRSFAALEHPGLPRFELMALPGAPLGNYVTTIPLDDTLDAIGLFAHIPPGESLAERCGRESNFRWTTAKIAPLIQSLAGSMSQLEACGFLAPPMPSPDRIWLVSDTAEPTDSGNAAVLWLDPAEYLSPKAISCANTLATHESRWLYAAPESTVQNATTASSVGTANSWASQAIYALGCLAYRLRFGYHAFAAAKDEQIRSRQQHFEPPELKEAVAKGAAGDPLLRVLGYALAKDPQSRFSSFDAFTQALAATLTIEQAATKPSTQPRPSKAAKLPSQLKSPPAPTARPAPKPTASKVTPPQLEPTAAAASNVASAPTVAPKNAATSQTPTPAADPAAAVVRPVALQTASHPPAQDIASQAPVQRTVHSTASVPDIAEKEKSRSVPASHPAPARQHPHPARRPSRRRTAWFILGSLWIPIILLIVALALQDPNAPPPIAKRTRPPIPAIIPSVGGSRSSQPRPRPPVRQPQPDEQKGDREAIEIVPGGRMLWAPPSALAATKDKDNDDERLRATMLLPPGPAGLTTFNLPSLDATGLRDAFDPELSPLWQQLQKRIAVPVEDVRLISLAWFPGRDGVPEIAIAVHLKQPRPLDELTEAWEASLAVVPGGVEIYAGDGADADAYYPHIVGEGANNSAAEKSAHRTDEPQQVDAFAVGSIARVTQVAEVQGAPVLLPRQLEELWQAARPTDAITMLSVPYFMIADSRAWMNRTAPSLVDWIRATLTPECGGFLIRVAAAPEPSKEESVVGSHGSYIELRLAVAPGKDPAKLKDKVIARVDEAAVAAENFLATHEVDPSWRLLAARLPSMWMFTGEQIRSAAIKREVIFNAYLPPFALPQLAVGTLLAANTTATTAIASGEKPATKLTMEEMLLRPMSVSFGQESLQFAVDTIVSEFAADLPPGNQPPKIEIIGGDLQKMGITQNQQVRNFDKKDLPLRTVLTDLMLGANPDRTATGPADPKQSLIWVVVGDGEEAEIKITTRRAAEGKYELPQEFITAE